MLHAVVQVDLDHLVGEVVDFFFVDPQLLGLAPENVQPLGELHALAGSGAGNAALQIGDGCAVAGLLLVNVVRADAGDGVRLVAVHIDQALEAVLLAAVKEPVDRPLLIDLQMVGIEVVDEVAADDVAGGALSAEGVRDEAEVFLQRGLSVDRLDELHEAAHNVIFEVFIIADGEDGVLVGGEEWSLES